MLINLRNALMAGKRLPYDAEVEYLESTGTQYVNTGVLIDTSTDTVEITFMPHAETSGYQAYYGTDETGNGQFSLRKNTNGNNIQVLKNTAVSAGITADEKWHTIKVTPNKAIVDGVDIALTQSDAQYTKSLMLFARITTVDTITAYAKCRVASFKIYRNGTLVRDYIPVRKGTVGYLYDRVTGRLFGNAGSGDFALGLDVVPVEYIESHGTEYIDTGVIATNSHGFRVDVATAQKSGAVNTRIFGVHEGNTRCGFALYGKAQPSGNDFFWGWNAATGFVADIPQRFVASLNYKNDRAAIFDGTTNLSSLGTLGSTTKSIYLLNANYNGAPFVDQYVVGRLYKAEISIGSDISNNFLPVRVGTDATSWEGAMMDVLTRRIYRNQGTGAFAYGNDLKYPIPAA